MTDAIEPWVTEEIRRQQLLEHNMTLHRAYIHQAQLRALQTVQTPQPSTVSLSPSHHSTVTAQHVDVDA